MRKCKNMRKVTAGFIAAEPQFTHTKFLQKRKSKLTQILSRYHKTLRSTV